MKTIFISYGDQTFKKSLKRIGKEAKNLNLFDKIILYTPKDLPNYIKSSPLMAYNKGSGYWLWKPFVIWKTLQDYGNDTVVIYSDAGNSLFKHNDWNKYLEKIQNFDTIVFKYKNNFDYGWSNFGTTSPKIKYWTKKNTLKYFDSLFSYSEWEDNNKILGGFIIVRNKKNNLIQQWLNISLLYPELIIDPTGNELVDQYDFFIEHRHDQSILTPLSYFYQTKNEVLILEESAESAKLLHQEAPIIASRLKDDIIYPKIKLKTRIIHMIKFLIGEKMYNLIHGRRI